MRPKLKLRTMRTVNTTIAATVLAVPASAVALTTATVDGSSPQASQEPLPVTVSPRHVAYGDVVHVFGRASGAHAGAKVMLQAATAPGFAWTRVAVATVDRQGEFSLRTQLPHSGRLRALPIPGEQVSTDTGRIAASGGSSPTDRVTTVQVTAKLTVPARRHDVLAGHPLYVAGRLLPGRAGRTVVLQGLSGNGWRDLASARTGAQGGFSIAYRATAGRERHLRITFRGDGQNARAVRAAGRLTAYEPGLASWYDDAGGTGCGFQAGLGVANRSLPCGTQVTFRYGGRTVTATVDDRGPYVYPREWDLDQNTAAALGFAGVGTVWASAG
ncbi:MAG: RlpA-like double-psi beta-barrel domain-containing protein [Solirubrobacterales bacterium]|nr:RlpA-like double-psi beta-barrel domain-containing protein [Solirubrobacterales bacterium]